MHQSLSARRSRIWVKRSWSPEEERQQARVYRDDRALGVVFEPDLPDAEIIAFVERLGDEVPYFDETGEGHALIQAFCESDMAEASTEGLGYPFTSYHGVTIDYDGQVWSELKRAAKPSESSSTED